MSSSRDIDDAFAVVGLSFRLPQDAVDDDSFWRVMEERRNLSSQWPENRAKLDSFSDGPSDKPNTLQTLGAHFTTDDPGVFDAPFFSITAKDAAAIDPQQRWVLETTYLAFENAGIPIESLRDSLTGVFGASMFDDYLHMLSKDPDTIPRQAITGLAPSLLANRVSWYFQLRGPSVHVNAACSSSMMALDIACKAMRAGDASIALVVGSNALLSPESSLYMANMNVLSPDNKCFSFDSRANGYGRGEGVVALVLKPLRDAISNGDVIRSVIRATASNQDGRTPVLTQPSADAQELLIRHVYEKAGLDFADTRYVEAHGTGTPAGDPVEMTAIGKVFRESRSSQEPLYVGSVKPNIGHLEGASGLASVLKAILVLEKGIIPPTALFETFNPEIDADFYNVKVPTKCLPWPAPGLRRVSVNCFGSGGSNAHVILDDPLSFLGSRGLDGYHSCVATSAPVHPNGNGINGNGINGNGINGNGINRNGISHSNTNGHSGPRSDSGDEQQSSHIDDGNEKLLVWTAADANAVRRTLKAYEDYYNVHVAGNSHKLAQLAYTLSSRRSILPWRSFAVVGAADEEALSAGPLPASQPVRASPEELGVAFLFTGQGAQYVGMGLELLRYPVFRESMERSDAILAGLGCKWSVLEALCNEEKIHGPELSQPLCTVLQIALVDLLASFNVVPAAVVGHSSGEIAASYAAGFLSHTSACKAAYFRGLLAQKLRSTVDIPGAMISVNLTETEVPKYLDALSGTDKRHGNSEKGATAICIACVNSPTNLTLSGRADAIEALKELLDEEGIFAHKLNTGVAYHSPAMRAIASEYVELMGSLDEHGHRSGSSITMVSSVTGGPVQPKMLKRPQYWVDNLVSPVQFAAALKNLTGNTVVTDLIEIGPHGALKRPVRETDSTPRYHSMLTRSKSPVQTTLSLIGDLFCHGHSVSVLAANQQTKAKLPFLVDCPRYPFDHSRRYWNESRLSKDFRFRPSSPGYLLGRRAHDWNPLQPRWRNWLCVETIPWLADHVVSGTTILPGAGMLVMTIEAVLQAATTNANMPTVAGLLFKEATFLAPITVGESAADATETELRLNPIRGAHEKMATWYHVRIFSHSKDRWIECFNADVQVQYEKAASPSGHINGERERRLEKQRICEAGQRAEASCSRPIDKQAFYEFTSNHGNTYGQMFRLLTGIAWDGHGTATARVNMAEAPAGEQSPVHPAVLDMLMQLLFAQVSLGLEKPVSTLVPARLSRAWFQTSMWHQATQTLRLSFKAHGEDFGNSADVQGTVYALGDDGSPLCAIEHLVAAEVARPGLSEEEFAGVERPLLYNITWKQQLSSLSPEELREVIRNTVAPASVETNTEIDRLGEIYPKCELAMRMAACKALREVPPEEIIETPTYIRKYASLLRHIVDSQELDEELGQPALEWLLEECETELPGSRTLPTVARALPSILRGETDPLSLMFSNGAAESFYEMLFQHHGRDPQLEVFLDLLSHENPGLRILEVGAGTGGMTRLVLDILWGLEKKHGSQGTRFQEYVYTDISPTFFEAARRKFVSSEDRGGGEEESRITFRKLDLEKDLAAQAGSDNLEGSYDLILAGSVLHATADLAATLRRVRRLLKPNGRLVLQEITAPKSVSINVGFGLLEGWWMGSEEWRQQTPLVTVERWDELLRETGFSGIDLTLKNSQVEGSWFSSIAVSTAVPGYKLENGLDQNGEANGIRHDPMPKLEILVDPDSVAQRDVATAITKQYPDSRIIYLEHVGQDQWKPSPADTVISLLEIGTPRLANMSESEFQAIQSLVQRVQNILWVTRPAHDNESPAHYAVATGFLRGIRTEESGKHVVSLAIESSAPGTTASYVTRVIRSCFVDEPSCAELEFEVRDGQFFIGRLMQEKELDQERKDRIIPQLRSERWQPGPPLKLAVGTAGMLNTLQFVHDDVTGADILQPDEVEIAATTWPVSFRDVLIALGRLGPQEGLGFECAGTITRLGAGCPAEYDLHVGDRVVMVMPGCMRSHPRAPAHAVVKIPDALSFYDAVSAMNPGMTAYHALVNVARLQPGEKILIHAAAGSTGQMAVGIAKRLIGAEVFATVGFEDKRQLLMDRFGIPEDHIFYSRDTSFAQGVMRVTGGAGVDVVLNSLSGDSLRASWGCMAAFGRFIEIGKADIGAGAALPMDGFARNVSFAAVDLFHISIANAKLTRALVNKVLELVEGGQVSVPGPLNMYSVRDVEGAFRHMQSGRNMGRIVVSMKGEDMVSTRAVQKREWQFDADASYLVAGGFGGLGRFILRWMADRGAKNLIIPSRSGISNNQTSDLVSELEREGVRVVAHRCDVSSASELSELLAECSAILPPIRGCINAAMALQDTVFEIMSYAQWSTTIRSKVATSHNLHTLLPQNMDFFILLSSLAGIYGPVGQSNYAAGCTFQDALARARTAAGHRSSVALDLGWMRTIGIVAERADYRRHRENARDMDPVEEEDLVALLEHFCDPNPGSRGVKSQVLVGAVIPAHFRAQGEAVPAFLARPLVAGFEGLYTPHGGTRKDAAGVGASSSQGEISPSVLFAQAGTPDERSAVVVLALRGKLARALGVDVEEVDSRKALSDYGVDSLMAVELRNWIRKDFGATVAVFEIMGGVPITAIGKLVVGMVA